MNIENYGDIPQKLAPVLNAISHPARIQIILHLAKYDECQAGSISENLPLARSTVSEHLNRLKEIGLINCNARANYLFYSLNEEKFKLIVGLLKDFQLAVEQFSDNKKACCSFSSKGKGDTL
ncbi:MAG: ArsR/SmtB family transcription factor [Marinifilaceae bacterium]